MMNPLDALTLARTKLRSHRVRTGITVAVAGLLFGLIIAVLFFVQGVFTSVDNYSKVGLNDRTLLSVARSPSSYSFDVYSHREDEKFIREVETAHKKYITRKQAAAKKYSVPYDPDREDPSPITRDPITKKKVISVESLSSEAVQQAAQARRDAANTVFDVDAYLNPYKSVVRRGTTNLVRPPNGSLTYMKEGKENQQVSSDPYQDSMISNGSGATLTILDGTVTEPFVTSTSFDPSAGEVPVIFPFSDAEKLLGLAKLPKEATPEERRERLRHVRDNVHTITAAFCYRSNASRMLMGQAVAQQELLKYQGNDEGFVQPALLYEIPDATDCSGVKVKSDTRSAAEKQAEVNRVLFEKEMGTWIGRPAQQKVVVRGVGISGDSDNAAATASIGALVTGLLNSTLVYKSWVIPQNLFDALPAASRSDDIFGTKPASSSPNNFDAFWFPQYLVEFGDKSEARALLERTGTLRGGMGEVAAYPFGSGTLFIDELQTWVERILFWALLVVGGIATITLWGVIGRTVADSRRESAVFRAIGATRSDIASIYGLYAFLLSLRVMMFALVLGLVLSIGVDFLYSDGATLAAQLAYAAADTHIRFGLFSVFSWHAFTVLGVIILAGLIASIIPIIFGVRRNPINDMRDDG